MLGSEGIWEVVAGVVAVGSKSGVQMILSFIIFAQLMLLLDCGEIIQRTVPVTSLLICMYPREYSNRATQLLRLRKGSNLLSSSG